MGVAKVDTFSFIASNFALFFLIIHFLNQAKSVNYKSKTFLVLIFSI